jgi:hypothetical protein
VTFPRGPSPDRPEKCEVFVSDRFELITAAVPPGPVRQCLGEADDGTRTPTQTTAQPQHDKVESGSLALSDPR